MKKRLGLAHFFKKNEALFTMTGADLIKLFWSKIYSKIQKKINPLLCG